MVETDCRMETGAAAGSRSEGSFSASIRLGGNSTPTLSTGPVMSGGNCQVQTAGSRQIPLRKAREDNAVRQIFPPARPHPRNASAASPQSDIHTKPFASRDAGKSEAITLMAGVG